MKSLGMSEIQNSDHLSKLGEWFKRFAEQAKDSPIYAYLSLIVEFKLICYFNNLHSGVLIRKFGSGRGT